MVKRTFSSEFKQQVVQEALETGNQSLVARRHGLRHNLVNRWVRRHQQGGALAPIKRRAVVMVVTPQEHRQLAAETGALRSENDQLKKLLGEKDLEIAILRDLVKKSSPSLLIHLVLLRASFSSPYTMSRGKVRVIDG